MADFVDQVCSDIDKRLNELKPLVAEYHRLEEAQKALGAATGTSSSNGRRSASRASQGTTRGTRRSTSTGRSPGRRPGSGQRAAQALEIVTKQPGIAIPDIAKKMGIQQNYLYRVLPGLEGEGKVRKDGRGWYPTGS